MFRINADPSRLSSSFRVTVCIFCCLWFFHIYLIMTALILLLS